MVEELLSFIGEIFAEAIIKMLSLVLAATIVTFVSAFKAIIAPWKKHKKDPQEQLIIAAPTFRSRYGSRSKHRL